MPVKKLENVYMVSSGLNFFPRVVLAACEVMEGYIVSQKANKQIEYDQIGV